MSAPTKIYLVLVAILCLVWAGVSTFVAAKGPGLWIITDPGYVLDHSDQFTGMLRGRVDVRDVDGQPIAPPESTLQVNVQARDASGTMAVQRIGTVQPDGVFEVLALPHGLATVSVQLGGGQTIWQREDIVVGGAGTLDPRIDPIDLGDSLVSFDLEVRGPDGTAARGGQLAWRQVGASNTEDVLTFDGVAPIGSDGRARFLSTSSIIDAICFVPGARTELFEELYFDSVIDLGPGTTIELAAEGTLPDPEHWIVHALLDPIELVPKVEVVPKDLDVPAVAIHAELDPKTGRVSIPVARGGRYRLTWAFFPRRGGHHFRTERLSDEVEIFVPSQPGTCSIQRTFQIDAFLRRVASR